MIKWLSFVLAATLICTLSHLICRRNPLIRRPVNHRFHASVTL